jgi:hypothetical protein
MFGVRFARGLVATSAALALSLSIVSASPAAAAAGCRWSIVPSPSPGTVNNELFAVEALSASDAWAVGSQISDPGGVFTPRPLALHWDGGSWTETSTPGGFNGNLAASVAFGPDDVWAVGSKTMGITESLPVVERWDGTAWSIVPSPAVQFGNLLGVGGTSSDDLWAVGTLRGFHPQMLIEHFDGTTWTVMHGPRIDSAFVALNAVAAFGASDVWAVGYDLGPDTLDKPLAVHFDGVGWTQAELPSIPNGSGILDDVKADGASALWAVGHSTDGSVDQTLALRWSGSAWSVVPTPDRATSDDLYGVTVDALGRAVAVGSAANPNGSMRTLVLTFAGQGWKVVPSPNPAGASQARLWDTAITADGSRWAVGDDNGGPVEQTLIMSC